MNSFTSISSLRAELRKEDKIKHMAWSFCLLMAGTLILPISTALLAVFFIGLIKEIWDKYYGSGFCFYDMIGNTIGMGLGTLIIIAFQKIYGS